MLKEIVQQTTGILLNDVQVEQFEKYYDYLVETNSKFNLTAITERQAVYTKHFADSLTASSLIADAKTVCDVGCGAGFPSIPLAIVNSKTLFTLVDSLNKRVEFCRQVASLCNLDNVTVVHSRAEDFAKNNRERFDVVTARAVAPLNILLEYLAPLTKVGGCVIAYKTDESEVANAQHCAGILGLKYSKGVTLTLPEGDNRCLLIYYKVRPTPVRYPRGGNQPRKNPLT